MLEKLNMTPPRPDRKDAGKRITLSLTPAALAGGVISLCAGFVLIFFLGVLLGRGHNLEERIPKLERILPEPATPAPPHIIAEDVPAPAGQTSQAPLEQQAGSGASSGTTGGPNAPSDIRQDGVIPQGELAFRDNLRTPASQARQPQAAGQVGGQAATPPSSGQSAQRAILQAAQPTTPPPGIQAAPPTSPAPAVDTQVYHYVYQVAAYRGEAACLAFVDRLQRAGLRARMEVAGDDGGTTWYRALVDFTGRPDETHALREIIQGFGIDRIMMRSRTPAN